MKTLAPRAAVLALLLSLLATAPAAAQTPLSPIEGTWNFLGGRIAIERQEDGSFLGTIIRRTRLDVCPQEIGERIWIDIRLQEDGSYWGQNQFFRSGQECEVVPDRGNVAFRVLNPAGQTYLRVCFGNPGAADVQPKIAQDGTATDAPGGCRDAEFFRLLPKGKPKLTDIAAIPSERRGCFPRSGFTFSFKEPEGDALKKVSVTLDGRRVRVVRRGGVPRAAVRFRDVKPGRHTLRIVARTARGRVVKGARRYRTCG